ncbi:tetratricopeptide repeat protein [Ancylomarina sp. 16SWW S1-10-2]|uniref:tetratricopeptide repeat-containing sensor histidine kinase n=1 Tax=Ancylomarina sp. 16SWW S1-10-2 TaxID=2499681 RepID=UPI0012AD59FC|nr:tetratricopeptide repeat protein [Ancylomarina sp. 16SWW S1-10-2]MRT93582.1 tetratricopeptide repeat protein [Ancylomarina sp. 16SWW S1-10-2]
MIRIRLFFTICLFLISNIISYAQSNANQNTNLSSKNEVTQRVKDLSSECWRLREINPDSAIIMGEEALQLASKYKLAKQLPQIYGYLSVVQLHYQYKTKESLPYLHAAIEHSLRQKDSTQLAFSYNNLGDLYLITGNIPLSLKFSEQSLELFILLGNSVGQSYSYVNVGLVYREKKDYNLAVEYFNKAKIILENENNELGVGSILLELARTYEEKGDLDVAMDFYQRAYNKSQISSSVRYAAFCLNGMANIFYFEKEYKKAFDYYQKSTDLNKTRNHEYGLIDDYIGMALVYAQQDRREEGETYLQKSLEIANRLSLNAKILKVYNSFATFYKILNDYKKATESYNQFLAQYDSIFSIQQFEIINEMQNRFTIRQTLSNTEKELDTRKFQETYLIVIIILMLIVAVVLFRQYYSHRKLNEKLEKINQTKDKMFSVISHDLKNPFNTLIGFSNILLAEVKEGRYDDVEEFTNYIHQSSHEGLKLLTTLLDWSRAQTGAIAFNPKPLDISNLFNDLNSLFESDVRKYKVKLEFHNSVDTELKADSDILLTILRNLISNAIKYTNENGVIQLQAQRKNSSIEITVKDNGTGMSKDIQDRLFDASKTTSSVRGIHDEQGTGLGLSICAELIKIHNGSIQVNSIVGEGSTFVIRFPFTK